jgi:hypothetical protein
MMQLYYSIITTSMKLYQKLSLGILISGITSFASVFAAGIDHFQVQLTPEDTQV